MSTIIDTDLLKQEPEKALRYAASMGLIIAYANMQADGYEIAHRRHGVPYIAHRPGSGVAEYLVHLAEESPLFSPLTREEIISPFVEEAEYTENAGTESEFSLEDIATAGAIKLAEEENVNLYAVAKENEGKRVGVREVRKYIKDTE